jgi:hypothetical protein
VLNLTESCVLATLVFFVLTSIPRYSPSYVHVNSPSYSFVVDCCYFKISFWSSAAYPPFQRRQGIEFPKETMGNTNSSAVEACFMQAVGGDSALVASPSKPNYESTDVKAYNLEFPLTPAAVTYPTTTQMVSDIIKCAESYHLKVQPRSGGHSYGNYGKSRGGVLCVPPWLTNSRYWRSRWRDRH